jgi:SnoaL-like domain
MDESALQELLDKQAIVEVMTAYTTGLDTRDWDLLKSCFTPDGDADFGALVGVGVLDSPDALVDLCRNSLQDLQATQHLQGNFEVQVSGDTATGKCYFQANHFLDGAPGGNSFVVWGTYRDQLVRTDGGWKIKHRELIPTATGGNQNLFAEAAELAGRTPA